ncbi:heat shock protein, partial [Thalassiosira pseudonana CCMP1335]
MRTPNPLLALLSLALPTLTLSKAILGVDLGSLYMKVALVQRNSPLEIVTNLHSKRKTEQMVLFDAGSRFYGADASSLMARKPHLTPSQMSVMLGRDAEHPSVQVLKERHYQFTPKYNETRSGICLTIDGNEFTPEELVAMVLTHAKDITQAYGVTTPVKDCVLTVPNFYTQHERRALLDAAELAELNVLALINENSAAALHFGIDRIDAEPQTYLFYNMGAGSVQVSVVKYTSYGRKESKYSKEKTVGAFEVLGTAWDATLGGASFDARLVDFMASEFNAVWNEKRGHTKDVREVPRAMAKLMIQANKVKHVLSANTDFPVFVDALHDDINYQTHISRAKFEEICHDLLERASAPIEKALKMANVTLDELNAVEMIGGAMRVPKVQEAVAHALGNKIELGMHLNSDESMALGAAFHGANVSTSFKVRHVGMSDVNPFPVAVDLTDLEKKDEKKDDGDWSKHATIFKLGSRLGTKKTIAFSYDKDVHVEVNYEESDTLPIGTGLSIEQYDVSGVAEFAKEMADKGLGVPKVSLQFEMTTSGLTSLIKAEAVVEETVMVDEEVEVEDDEEDATTTAEDAAAEEKATDGYASNEEDAKSEDAAASDETKEDDASAESKEKKKKIVRALKVDNYHVGSIRPYSPEIMEESQAKLGMLAQKDKERMMLEEAKNNYEAYIYFIRNKLIDDEEAVAKVTNEEQREALRKSAEDAEEWMFDEGFNADIKTYNDKYAELSAPAEKAFGRVAELEARPKAIEALEKKLEKVGDLMKKWETTMEHITEEERSEVLDKVAEVRAWIAEKVKAQEEADQTSDPVFTSEEVPGQTKKIESIVARLMKKPKPKPVKKEETDKNETAEEGSDLESEEKTEGEST